jgi:polyisoprenoid-binding protein YceI
VSLVVPTQAVSTGLAVLDSRLREDDLLASTAHPQAYFVAEHFVFDGPTLREVRGEFTLRGISRPLTLQARRFACGTHPVVQRGWCGGDFEAELRRSDYGLSFGLPLVADRVRLLVQVEAIQDP